jgi:hypothetical protein
MTTRNFLKTCLSLCLVCTLLAFGMTADAQQQAKRPYTEVVFSDKTSDPKAVAIVQKLLAKDLESLKQYSSAAPKIYARFQALSSTANAPKTSIFAMIEHLGYCGSQGCRTVILSPTKNNKYSLTFDSTIGRIFINPRQGKDIYDILALDGYHTDGFGVFTWNEAKKSYNFAGISKFKK